MNTFNGKTDEQLNAEVELFMNRVIYEVDDRNQETVYITPYKVDALDVHKFMEKGEVVCMNLVTGEAEIIQE